MTRFEETYICKTKQQEDQVFEMIKNNIHQIQGFQVTVEDEILTVYVQF